MEARWISANCTRSVVLIIVSCLRAADLTHAVNLENFDIKTHEIVQNFLAQRSRCTEEASCLSKTQLIFHFPVNHFVCQLKRNASGFLSTNFSFVKRQPSILCPHADRFLDAGVRLPDHHHLLSDFFPNSWHSKEYCWLSFFQGSHQGSFKSILVGKVKGA